MKTDLQVPQHRFPKPSTCTSILMRIILAGDAENTSQDQPDPTGSEPEPDIASGHNGDMTR